MLPSTVLVSILRCLKRRDLDVLELVDRAFGPVIDTHENRLPRRSLSLTFFNEGGVSVISFKDAMKHLQVVELPEYLSHSVITKMLFKMLNACIHSLTGETYSALLACRANLAADAVCDFHSLSLFHPDILHSAFTEVFTCSTLVFSHRFLLFEMCDLRHNDGAQQPEMIALPCVANCTNLQVARYHETLFDANGALEWLLGTHAAAAGAKHLFIAEVSDAYWQVFLSTFLVAIEQQFIRATLPASFTVELRYTIERRPGPDVGATRVHAIADTNEQLEVLVDTSKAFRTNLTIHRKPAA